MIISKERRQFISEKKMMLYVEAYRLLPEEIFRKKSRTTMTKATISV
jgi:hypothetical protein